MYGLLISGSLMWVLSLVIAGAHAGYLVGPDFFISFLAFIGVIVGISIFTQSQRALVSLLGVSMVGYLLGMSIGPVLAYYNATTIISALQTTLLITLVMSTLGILFPRIIMKASGVVIVLLLAVTISYWGQFLFSLFGIYSPIIMRTTDYIAVALFSLLIWYDWSRAMALPRTVDNAIDASGGIAISIVNLFMTLLRLGRRR